MKERVIFANEFLNIIEKGVDYYVRVTKEGLDMGEMNEILLDFPRVRVTQFIQLKKALEEASNEWVLFTEQKELIEVSVSKDKLEAFAVLNMTEHKMENYDIKELMSDFLYAMDKKGVIYGFDIQEIVTRIQPMRMISIAKGKKPVKGRDAITKYYEINEIKPEVDQKGEVNHYELNLINKVIKDEWVGERHEPQEGIPGKTVTGEVIPALKGDQEPLKYDRKTIYEEYDEEKEITYIRSSRVGAVVIDRDVISICNYLEIEGKVSFKTGNVDFDGFVDVKDIVEDNFSVVADNDIQILGDMGIGGVDHIESREGSIYIRGGIAGKGKAKIICDGDLYTKFASDCEIQCKGTVHIGYYALNANITAKEVVFDTYKSKMMGGHIEAKIRVSVGTVGNRMETPTSIKIHGFKREEIKEEYEFINETIDRVKDKINLLKQQISLLEMVAASDSQKKRELDAIKEKFDFFRNNLKLLYEKQKKSISYMRAKGEGEIVVSQGIYPKVQLSIKNDTVWNHDVRNYPITYYTDGRNIVTI